MRLRAAAFACGNDAACAGALLRASRRLEDEASPDRAAGGGAKLPSESVVKATLAKVLFFREAGVPQQLEPPWVLGGPDELTEARAEELEAWKAVMRYVAQDMPGVLPANVCEYMLKRADAAERDQRTHRSMFAGLRASSRD